MESFECPLRNNPQSFQERSVHDGYTDPLILQAFIKPSFFIKVPGTIMTPDNPWSTSKVIRDNMLFASHPVEASLPGAL